MMLIKNLKETIKKIYHDMETVFESSIDQQEQLRK